jgi:ubiquinone/menaquinone biosynthesis C-methylase UbiE
MSSGLPAISRVTRTRAQARASYDRMSRFYDLFTGAFEQKYKNLALQRLAVVPGEVVLELGCGTGTCLVPLARAVGETGRVFGLDLSPGMLSVSRRRLQKAGLSPRVELTCEDALAMPYPDGAFDALFASFVLELFDTPEIPGILAQARRVLKPGGRLGLISMSKGDGRAPLLSLYEWFHQRLPAYVDCRPIFVERAIREVGFAIAHSERVSMLGLPGEIVIGIK